MKGKERGRVKGVGKEGGNGDGGRRGEKEEGKVRGTGRVKEEGLLKDKKGWGREGWRGKTDWEEKRKCRREKLPQTYYMTTARLEGGARKYKTEFPPIVSFSDLGHFST